jgi:hypothetical protein
VLARELPGCKLRQLRLGWRLYLFFLEPAFVCPAHRF